MGDYQFILGFKSYPYIRKTSSIVPIFLVPSARVTPSRLDAGKLGSVSTALPYQVQVPGTTINRTVLNLLALRLVFGWCPYRAARVRAQRSERAASLQADRCLLPQVYLVIRILHPEDKATPRLLRLPTHLATPGLTPRPVAVFFIFPHPTRNDFYYWISARLFSWGIMRLCICTCSRLPEKGMADAAWTRTR